MLLNINSFVRLACIKHAASVRYEPGSNSQVWILYNIAKAIRYSPDLKTKISCSYYRSTIWLSTQRESLKNFKNNCQEKNILIIIIATHDD